MRLQANPAHKRKVVCSSRCNDIIDSIIEDGDGSLPCQQEPSKSLNPFPTRHTNNDQWLGGENRKQHRTEHRREQYFVDTITHIGLGKHVQRER